MTGNKKQKVIDLATPDNRNKSKKEIEVIDLVESDDDNIPTTGVAVAINTPPKNRVNENCSTTTAAAAAVFQISNNKKRVADDNFPTSTAIRFKSNMDMVDANLNDAVGECHAYIYTNLTTTMKWVNDKVQKLGEDKKLVNHGHLNMLMTNLMILQSQAQRSFENMNTTLIINQLIRKKLE
mmetsp:Transcript_3570/g.3878  ORF Transcript_3570/g.3878 Transcript_3570/m.3878 type:complete len:181 (+) Transcript_3570:994-1536(+)